MIAPCLIRLDKSIAEASDEIARARLLTEKACYLARVGRPSEAEQIRVQVRDRFGSGVDLVVTVRIMVLEGILGYFQNLGSNAGDRVLRANFLSKAAGDKDLIAFTAAWLSLFHHYDGKYVLAIEAAKQAICNVREGDTATFIRIGLLFGDLFLLVNKSEPSQRWYELARRSAVSYGDQAAIGALTYNRAALKVFNLRLRRAQSLSMEAAELSSADAEFRTASNYHYATEGKSLEHLLTTADVSLKILRHEYAAAFEKLSDMLSMESIPKEYPYRAVLFSDLALCQAALGSKDEAISTWGNHVFNISERLHSDDALLVYATLAECMAYVPTLEKYWDKETFHRAADRFRLERFELTNHLTPFETVPDELRDMP